MAVENAYQGLIAKLDEFIRKYYKNRLLKGAILSGGICIAFFTAASTIEYFGEFGQGIRALLFFSLLIVSLWVLIQFIFIPLLKLYRYGKVISHEEAASIIGNHFSNVQDKLLNVLQLRNNQTTGSMELIEAGINQKIRELHPVPFHTAINLKTNYRYVPYLAFPLFVFLLILVWKPQWIQSGTSRLIHYNTFYEKQAPFKFLVTNKNLKTMQNEDFELVLETPGEVVPAEVNLILNGYEYRMNKDGNSTFRYIIRNPEKNTAFQFTANGFTSKPYQLEVIPRPVLSGFNVFLDYPAYLNRKDEWLNNAGDLVIPQGTQVQWKFETRNAQFVQMLLGDSVIKLQANDENLFIHKRRMMKSLAYSVKTGSEKIQNQDSLAYFIQVEPDARPLIEITERKDSLQPRYIYFSGKIQDDHGFSRLIFHYQKNGNTDSTNNSNQERDFEMNFQRDKNVQGLIHSFDLGAFDLKPGDQVEYYFEVWDNDAVNGAKSARSAIQIFKAPSLEELEKRQEANQEEIKKDLEESLKKAKELSREMSELNKKIMDKKQPGWEEKKKMEDLLNKQKELQKKIEETKNENLQNNQEQNEYKTPDENILEKQKEIEKLFENIMTPEMKKLFEELQKMMQQLADKNKMQQAMEQLKLNNKDLEKELDRVLEQFKRMEAEQKLENLTQKMDELSKKQEELSKETLDKNSDQKSLEKKQDEINKKFEELKKDAQSLKEMNEKLEDKMNLPDQQNKQEEVSKEQQKASDQLQKNNRKNAEKSQQKAAEKMQEMAKEMQQSMDQMQQDQNEEDMQSVRQIMENLLHLSFSQEDLIKQSQIIKNTDPNFNRIGQTQKKLQDDARIIEDSLLALSKRNPKISATVNREISSIRHYMNKSIEELVEAKSPLYGDGNSSKQMAQSHMQYSMTSINNLALLLNESLEKMQMEAKEQMKKKGSGGGSCKKPGKSSGQGQPKFSNMKQMQEQLNKQIAEMKKMMEQGKMNGGKKPGEKPGNGMGNTPGMSEQLAKMAAEQEAIRRALQEAMQKTGGNNPGGDLQKLMEETENDLVNKRISQETINRQQQILTRLLEHEKAEREKEFDEKRKSNESKDPLSSNPPDFLEYKRMKEQEMELIKTLPPALNPYYKNKVSSYFNTFTK